MEGIQINVCEKQINLKKEYRFEVLTSAMFIVGWIWLYMSAFSFWERNWMLLALFGVFISIVLVILQNSRWGVYLFPAGCLLGIIIFLIGFTYGKNGVLQHINEILVFMTGWQGRIYLDYPVEAEKGIWFIGILLVFMVALFMTISMYKNRLWAVVLLVLPGIIGYSIGFFHADISWIFLFGTMAMLIYRKNKNSGEANRYSVWSSILILLFSFLLAIGISVFLPDMSTNKLVSDVQDKLHSWKYDCTSTSMPEGKLSNLKGWEKDDTIALEIETKNSEKLYIRGMIGQEYTGTTWEDYDAKTRKEAESLFYWLHQSGYYGQESIGSALAALQKLETYEMTIKNKAACKLYQYLPYALSGTATLNPEVIGDGSAYAKEQEQTILCYPGSVPEWYETAVALAENQSQDAVAKHLRQEQSYREFVYENNLQLTDAAVGVCKSILGEGTEARGLSEIQELIQKTLENTLTYNDLVTTNNGKNDFFQYTMEQGKRGYSVHYATAATLMFRYLGVPTRYVEGYFLSSDEASSYEDGDTIFLKESHAHAWTEYYLDGIGWIPFEVTPGYIDDEEILAIAKTVENEVGENVRSKKKYAQSKLQYTPPKHLENEKEITELNNLFKLEAKHIIGVLLFLLLAAIVLGIMYVILRRKKLYNALTQIHQMDNRNAIAALFAYATMLMKKADIQKLDRLEYVYKINQKVMFSNHDMTDQQREETEIFAVHVIDECKKIWNPWKRLWYHYIFWLYR